MTRTRLRTERSRGSERAFLIWSPGLTCSRAIESLRTQAGASHSKVAYQRTSSITVICRR